MTVIVHIVLIELSAGISEEERNLVRRTARSLASTIPGIERVEEGGSVSPEGLEHGFDYALVITFRDAQARDAYLPHPDHQILAGQISRHAKRVIVFDLKGAVGESVYAD